MIESIAIGSFDGIHIAHKELIKRADGVVVIERFCASLTPGWKRTLYVSKPFYFYTLESIKNLTPREFIKKLVSDFPALKKIIVGYDFMFGRDKIGNIKTLKESFKGEVVVVDEVKFNNTSVHTRVIRDLLQKQKIQLANKMLGRRYAIDGYQIRGLGLGGKELMPTINLEVKDYILPRGVFAVIVAINNKHYNAVAFIGNRVTIDNSFSVEVHILDDFNGKFSPYTKIWVEFVDFIRKIEKFDSIETLKEAINSDCKIAKEILKKR